MLNVSSRPWFRWSSLLVRLVVLVALGAPAASAQNLYGGIVGVVKDPQGASVPGATVTIVNKDTNHTKELVTDTDGTFMFNNVFIEDVMMNVLGDLFRLPIDNKPITVMQTAGFPAEVVDAVVSVV